MKICLVAQARMRSERLPGKVMKEVLRKPLLEYELERLCRVRTANEVLVATTQRSEDQPIADLCGKLSVLCFRGSEEDVLGRYYETAQWRNADAVIRVTADCPLIDPGVVDRVVGFYRDYAGQYDYVSNTLQRTFPRGMDCEVFGFRALEEAFLEARSQNDREHVTPFIYKHPGRYRLGPVTYDRDESHRRWTVDTAEDFELIEKILTGLYPAKRDFTLEDVLGLLSRNPGWERINEHVRQRN